MHSCRVTIISIELPDVDSVWKLSEKLRAVIPHAGEAAVSEYPKFTSAWKVEVDGILDDHLDANHALIQLSDRICGHCLVYYDPDTLTSELLFNPSYYSHFGDEESRKIRRAQFGIRKDGRDQVLGVRL